MKRIFTALVIALCLPAVAAGQVLTTAETLGRGTQAILVSENRLFIAGDELNIAYANYVRGITNRFDLYVSIGETHFSGEGQVWLGAGGNLGLVRAGRLNVSVFNIVSVPLHRRDEACTVLLNSAIVASWKVSDGLTLYSGLNSLWPIGVRERGFFTPTEKLVNIPAGAAIFLGKWAIFAEGDFGKLKAVGMGLGRTF